MLRAVGHAWSVAVAQVKATDTCTACLLGQGSEGLPGALRPWLWALFQGVLLGRSSTVFKQPKPHRNHEHWVSDQAPSSGHYHFFFHFCLLVCLTYNSFLMILFVFGKHAVCGCIFPSLIVKGFSCCAGRARAGLEWAPNHTHTTHSYFVPPAAGQCGEVTARAPFPGLPQAVSPRGVL